MASFAGRAPSELSVKELRELIKSAGLSSADCLEKADLVRRAGEAQERLKTRAPAPAPSSGRGGRTSNSVRVLGGYETVVHGLDGTRPDVVVVVLHGFGASSSDFAPLSASVTAALRGRKAVFAFPQAPPSPLAMGAAAWWQIDVLKWMGAMQAGEPGIARLIRDKPPGLDEARRKLAAMLDELCDLVPGGREAAIVLGGFSQGGMTALDLALHLDSLLPHSRALRCDHVMVLSSAPIVVDEWAERLKTRGARMQVLITHGHGDMVLPFPASGWTKELLEQHGAKVRYETHAGGHELGGPHILKAVCDFCADAAAT
jgi:phospholipase/carboxylesterase